MKKEHYRKIIFNTLISSDAIMIVFDSVCILSKKKKNLNQFFLKKKLKPVQTDRFRFDFFGYFFPVFSIFRFFYLPLLISHD